MASLSGMDLDLFYQGKSTGSGLFDLEASEGNGSELLDENGLAFSDCAPESPLDPDRAFFFLQVLHWRSCKFLMWKHSMVI